MGFCLLLQKITEFKNFPDNFLPVLWADCKQAIGGLHWSYYYLGTPGSYFGQHLEDMDLASVNFHCLGDPKMWYVFFII